MIFGEIARAQAEGAVLAHAIKLAEGRLPKGHRLDAEDIEALGAAGIDSVVAAQLAPGDLPEDEAAAVIAGAIIADNLRTTEASTGRVNIHATDNGLFVANRDLVDRFNAIDPAITLACLADRSPVAAGDMVATIKIIPLAVPGSAVMEALAQLKAAAPFQVMPYGAYDVTLIATRLPQLKESVMDKTARVLAQRLSPSRSRIGREIRVAHEARAVAEAIARALAEPQDLPPMIVIFGASAVSDAEDVIPAAIRLAGGQVTRVGLPVDPGNLLVLGFIGEIPVIGAPGCARSPKENGFDWVLNRILAGDPPDAADLSRLGVGGLLKEIPTRPMPRDRVGAEPKQVQVAALVLAAGQARRMGEGGPHKLLAEFEGKPLIRLSAEKVLASSAAPVAVVTGHRREDVMASLSSLEIAELHNPDYASGMASSLRTGLADPALLQSDGVLVMLADMPAVSVADLDALIAAFRAHDGQVVVRASADGKRGNPVILPRAAYPAVLRLEGDVGARAIIESGDYEVVDIEIGSGAHLDVDTPEAVLAAGGILKD